MLNEREEYAAMYEYPLRYPMPYGKKEREHKEMLARIAYGLVDKLPRNQHFVICIREEHNIVYSGFEEVQRVACYVELNPVDYVPVRMAMMQPDYTGLSAQELAHSALDEVQKRVLNWWIKLWKIK